MLVKLALLVLGGLVADCYGIPWDPIFQAGRSVLVRMLSEPTCTQLYSCLDCGTARICRPNGPDSWTEVVRVPCPADAPYCDKYTGTCGQEPDGECGQGDTFICPRENGHFPDPSNCSLYHVCEKYTATQFACAYGLQYNPLNEDCEANATCAAPVHCKEQGRKVVFPDNPVFYAYCYNGKPTVVDRCPGDYEMNVTSQVCEATCRSDGVLRDFEDCTKFFFCHTVFFSKEMNVRMKESMSCPKDQGFDPKLNMCRDISLVEGCVPPNPTQEPSYPPTATTGTATAFTVSTVTHS